MEDEYDDRLPVVDALGSASSKDDMLRELSTLDETKRIARIFLVIDEVRKMARHLRDGSNVGMRVHITPLEFFVCGGPKSVLPRRTDLDADAAANDNVYSFYRQLVHAKRDADVYVARQYPPSGRVKKAARLYTFYDSADSDVEPPKRDMSNKDVFAMPRVAWVLKRFRRFMRKHDLCSPEAAVAFAKIGVCKDEFVVCGGHKTCKATDVHSFYRLVVMAKRDMQLICERGRFSKARPPIPSPSGRKWREVVEPAGRLIDAPALARYLAGGTGEGVPDDDVTRRHRGERFGGSVEMASSTLEYFKLGAKPLQTLAATDFVASDDARFFAPLDAYVSTDEEENVDDMDAEVLGAAKIVVEERADDEDEEDGEEMDA